MAPGNHSWFWLPWILPPSSLSIFLFSFFSSVPEEGPGSEEGDFVLEFGTIPFPLSDTQGRFSGLVANILDSAVVVTKFFAPGCPGILR